MRIQTLPIIFMYGTGMFLAGHFASQTGGVTSILFGGNVLLFVIAIILIAGEEKLK